MTNNFNLAFKLAPVLFVLDKLGSVDKHQLFKILYFADKRHLAMYGRPIFANDYHAMENGPVPSELYDFVKIVDGTSKQKLSETYKNAVRVFLGFRSPHLVFSKQRSETKFLSKAATQLLEGAIEVYKNKGFSELSDLSHDSAWKSVPRDKHIPIESIAKAAGANDEMIKYIQTTN